MKSRISPQENFLQAAVAYLDLRDRESSTFWMADLIPCKIKHSVHKFRVKFSVFEL
jgi:hypothetical protein